MIAAMQKHLSEMHEKTVEANCLVKAMQQVIHFPDRQDISISLIDRIGAVVADLSDGLDDLTIGKMTEHKTETPIVALYRQIEAINEKMKAFIYAPENGDADDDLVDRLFHNEIDRLEEAMMATPCQTPQDMAAKMIVAHGFGGASCIDYNGRCWAEARALVDAI